MTRRRLSSTEDRRATYEGRFELGALFEFSTIINASFDLRFILGHFLLTLMGKLLSLRGIVLLEKKDLVYSVESVKGLPGTLVGKEIEINKLPHRLIYVNDENSKRLPWKYFFKEHGIHFLVPLATGNKILGVAGFAPSAVKKKLADKETTYVKSLANIAASAIEKSLAFTEINQINRRLDRKVQELNTLFEVSKEFNTLLDPDRVVKLLMYSIMGQIGVHKFFICLDRDNEMQVAASRLENEITPELRRYFTSVTAPVVIDSLTQSRDRAIQLPLKEMGIQVLVPLQLQHHTKGILGLGEKVHGGDYSHTDLEFLFSLGSLAVTSLENARLFEEAIEKQKMEDELLIAKEIQRGLLPAKLPNIPHFELAAINLSSKQVGGDYYDVISLGNSKYIIAIGDVSGKGVPASLLMANLQATIRALVPMGLSLADLTKRVNDLIYDSTSTDRFITFFWGMIDAKARTMEYVNAGHNLPFLFRVTGRVERLDKGGIILGVMKSLVPYQEGKVKFNSGDVLLLFTDGVSEAMNIHDEELGEEQLEKMAKVHLKSSPKMLLSHIVEEVKNHSKNVPQSDDVTLLVVKTKA